VGGVKLGERRRQSLENVIWATRSSCNVWLRFLLLGISGSLCVRVLHDRIQAFLEAGWSLSALSSRDG
jgi:hypothetical protein